MYVFMLLLLQMFNVMFNELKIFAPKSLFCGSETITKKTVVSIMFDTIDGFLSVNIFKN